MYLQSKYDVATYREKAPHLSYREKVDLIKNVFVSEKNFRFPETTRSFKYAWLLLFPWLFYSASDDASYRLPCVLFGHDFPAKASRVKNLFSQPSGLRQALFLTLELIVKAKRRKIDPSDKSFQSLHFQHGLNLKLCSLKSKVQVMKLICYVIEKINMRLKKTVKY